jgi:hypothetical protein
MLPRPYSRGSQALHGAVQLPLGRDWPTDELSRAPRKARAGQPGTAGGEQRLLLGVREPQGHPCAPLRRVLDLQTPAVLFGKAPDHGQA